MAIKRIRAGKPITANAATTALMLRTRWVKTQTPQALRVFFEKNTGGKVVDVMQGDGPMKGALRINLGKIDDAVQVIFCYFPKQLKESGFVISPLPTLLGYFGILADTSRTIDKPNANLIDIAPLVQTERALKFLSGTTSAIEKIAVRLKGATPVIVNGMEDMIKQIASENEQSDKDLKDVEEKYLRN